MLKTLFKKQMMELNSYLFLDKKKGKSRSKGSILLYLIFYLALFVLLGVIFGMVADMLARPLIMAGMGWMYFTLMGLVAVALGAFGSVFNTYASLYQAKDNDQLLSMPIPNRMILIVRLFGVYMMGLLYELLVMLPTAIVYYMVQPVTAASLVCIVLVTIGISIFILTLSCALGFVVAAVSAKVKNKSLITVVLSLVFLAAYYYCYSRAFDLIRQILANTEQAADAIKTVLYPFYHMGLAADGDPVSMLIFTAIVLALFAVVYLMLSRSFLKIATTNRGASKVVYKEKLQKRKSIDGALLYKEWKRFLGSPAYMLNCALGTVLMPVMGVFVIVKREMLTQLMQEIFAGNDGIVALLTCAAVCMMATMNDVTAPSVSLEGKNLWLLQSLPVPAWKALKAKLKIHLWVTIVPAFISIICMEIVFQLDILHLTLVAAGSIAFICFMALVGLLFSLKLPNLKWTSETIAVKQSMSVMLALFGGWGVIAALGFGYYLLNDRMTPEVFLLCMTAVCALLSVVIIVWMKRRGSRILERLG